MHNALEGKTAIITGAARGQGAAAAVLFARQGARLILVDVDQAELERTADAVREHGATVRSAVLDVGDRERVPDVLQGIIAEDGAPDVLYNNAGILLDGRGDGDIHELDWDALERVFHVNLFGVMIMCRAVLPSMMESGRGGSIINTSTLGALIGTAVHAYSASKGGVLSLTRSLATSYGRYGIRANTIAPGFIATDLSRKMLANERYRERLEKTIPLQRIGDPDDVAAVALFLASDASRYVSGTVVPVDGGLLAV